jgi:anti-anti-sigma regulatory factor
MITAAQMRAARALLGIDQRALAELSGLSLPTIQRMEAITGTVRGVVESLIKVVDALNRAGVELIGEHGSTGSGNSRGIPPNRVPMVSTGNDSAQVASAAAVTAIRRPGQAGRTARKITMMAMLAAATAIAERLAVGNPPASASSFGISALGSLFINRMAEMTGIEAGTSFAIADRADDGNGERVPYDPELAVDRDVLVYRITGAFFFGAAAAIGSVLDGIADKRKAFVVDFAAVPFLDSTAANAMGRVAAKARRQGIQLFITGASPKVRRALLTHGVSPPRARYRETIARAVADIKNKAAGAAAASNDLAAG